KAETPKAPSAAKKSAPVEAGQGGYWVQVGAFAEERNAEALSKQLKGENFPVTISRISRGGSAPAAAKAPSSAAPAAGGQNQLFITGSPPEAVNAALKGKGTAQPVKGGLVVNPPFDLETAMSLSSSLKKEGFKVVIRRAQAAPAPSAPPSSEGGGTIFHVVRVGGYPDRAKAQQVRGELEAKGHRGFLMQGAARCWPTIRRRSRTTGGDSTDEERSHQRGGSPRAVQATVRLGGGIAVRHHLPLLREERGREDRRFRPLSHPAEGVAPW